MKRITAHSILKKAKAEYAKKNKQRIAYFHDPNKNDAPIRKLGARNINMVEMRLGNINGLNPGGFDLLTYFRRGVLVTQFNTIPITLA